MKVCCMMNYNFTEGSRNTLGCNFSPDQCDVLDWKIKPLRRQSKVKFKEVCGLTHRDVVSYTTSKNERVVGYITAMYEDKRQVNIQTKDKKWGRVTANKCKLVNRPNKIMWHNGM